MSPIKRSNQISGQWSPRLIEMLESPAYRALSRSGHMVISRIEIELAHHGGNDNGRLPVTTEDFVEYGMHRTSVAPAIREVEALGFIRITERGRGGNAEHRSPNLFFLTFAHGRDSGKHPPTHDWRRAKTLEEAEQIARAARAAKNSRAVAHGKSSWKKRQQKQKAGTGNSLISIRKNCTEKVNAPVRKPRTTGLGEKTVPLSIAREGERSAPVGSAVASEPSHTAAIDLLMQTHGCSHAEAVEILESIPNAPPRSSECALLTPNESIHDLSNSERIRKNEARPVGWQACGIDWRRVT